MPQSLLLSIIIMPWLVKGYAAFALKITVKNIIDYRAISVTAIIEEQNARWQRSAMQRIDEAVSNKQ